MLYHVRSTVSSVIRLLIRLLVRLPIVNSNVSSIAHTIVNLIVSSIANSIVDSPVSSIVNWTVGSITNTRVHATVNSIVDSNASSIISLIVNSLANSNNPLPHPPYQPLGWSYKQCCIFMLCLTPQYLSNPIACGSSSVGRWKCHSKLGVRLDRSRPTFVLRPSPLLADLLLRNLRPHQPSI